MLGICEALGLIPSTKTNIKNKGTLEAIGAKGRVLGEDRKLLPDMDKEETKAATDNTEI